MDYCPFTIPYSNRKCDNTSSGETVFVGCGDDGSIDCLGSVFGPASACMSSSLILDGYTVTPRDPKPSSGIPDPHPHRKSTDPGIIKPGSSSKLMAGQCFVGARWMRPRHDPKSRALSHLTSTLYFPSKPLGFSRVWMAVECPAPILELPIHNPVPRTPKS
jgi:hypothetical protein